MKAISRNPAIVQNSHCSSPNVKGRGSTSSKKDKKASYELQIELFGMFVEQYEIAR